MRYYLPDLAEDDIDRLIEVGKAARAARAKGSVDFDFSIRTLVQIGRDASMRTGSLLKSFESVVLPKMGDPLEYEAQHKVMMEIAKMVLK